MSSKQGERNDETANRRTTGPRRLRGSHWPGTDRRGRRYRQSEPGKCANHRYSRGSLATSRPKPTALRRRRGCPALPPPLTNDHALGIRWLTAFCQETRLRWKSGASAGALEGLCPATYPPGDGAESVLWPLTSHATSVAIV